MGRRVTRSSVDMFSTESRAGAEAPLAGCPEHWALQGRPELGQVTEYKYFVICTLVEQQLFYSNIYTFYYKQPRYFKIKVGLFFFNFH